MTLFWSLLGLFAGFALLFIAFLALTVRALTVFNRDAMDWRDPPPLPDPARQPRRRSVAGGAKVPCLKDMPARSAPARGTVRRVAGHR